MIENQTPITQIVSFIFCSWFLKDTVIAVLKSVFGVEQSLSDSDKIRARVLSRLDKANIKRN